MKFLNLQNIKEKYPVLNYIFIFLLIITISILILKLSEVKRGDNNFAAVYSSIPDPETDRISALVSTIVPDASGGVYIGGNFTIIGPYTGRGVPILSSTGSTTGTFPKVNNIIRASVQDTSGGWYIGGDFTQVGTVTRNRVAHILSDGSVDLSFDPNIVGSDVQAITLSPDESTLYFGGNFTSINSGVTRTNLAAVNATSGVATAFDPNVNSNVRVVTLSSDGDTLYMGGGFTTVNGGTARNFIAAVDASTGILVSGFDPNADNAINTLALSSDGATLYAGGQFTNIGGASRSRIAAVSTSTGLATAFDPNANTTVNTLDLSSDGNTLYMGGNFTTVNGGTARNFIAAVDASTGILVSGFDPNMNGAVNALTLSLDGNTLYIGGGFTTVNGGTARNRIAAVSTSTGLVTTFNSNANNTVTAITLSSDGSVLYIGGSFTIFNGIIRNRIAHILSDGTLDPNFDPDANGQILTMVLSTSTNTLYMGGGFTTVNGGTVRNNIASVDASTGILVGGFDPNVNNSSVNTLAISLDGNTLYMGGSFTTVNGGTARNFIAAVDASTGILVGGFDPNANSSVTALALSSDESTLYMGGGFTTVNGGTARNRIAAVSTSTGLVTAFNPNASSNINALVLSADGSTLYMGGFFTSVGGVARNRIAAVSTTTALVTAFNPNASGQVSTIALSSNGNTLYIGGFFGAVGGIARSRVAEVDASTGSTTTFNPNSNSLVTTLAISLDGNTLYMGGQFSIVGGVDRFFFTSFPRGDPTITTNTLSTIGQTTATLLGNITSAGQASLTERGFRYGTSTQSLSSSTFETSGLGTGVYSISISDLVCETTYEYQAYAVNSFGSSTGIIRTFDTSACSSGGRRRTTTEDTTAVGGDTTNGTSTLIVATTTGEVATTTTVITTSSTTSIPPFTFTRVLRYGSVGGEVKQLQIFLNTHGFIVTQAGLGSIGNEITYFGKRTRQAVIKFQEAYTNDILIPQGITEGTGIFLNYSRAKANEILSGERN